MPISSEEGGSPLKEAGADPGAHHTRRALAHGGLPAASAAQATLALFLLIIAPFVVKAPLLLGLLISDPVVLWSGLSEAVSALVYGPPSIDPNIAYTSHALGTLAARSVSQGDSLWWNPYEGLGAPLAGEMQSAALFPLTWLMVLPNGQLIEHLLFQVIAGVAAFGLLRRLGVQPLGAWLGGTAFAFNGVFAWLANAVINPVCFLPVLLLGVETLRSPTRWGVAVGGLLVTFGLAASLYAGFPEVAYLNGLLVAAWTVLRTVQDRADGGIRYLLLVMGFAVCGLLVSAPILIAFFDYLQHANVGIHDGAAMGDRAIAGRYATMRLLPYYVGFLFRDEPMFWGNVGGYAGFALTALAVAACVGRPERGLRMVLSVWVVACTAGIFGIEPLSTLIRLIPGVALVAFYRYADASVLMALAILAGFAIDDLARGRTSLKTVRRATLATLIATGLLVVVAASFGVYPKKAMWLAPTLGQLAIVAMFLAALAWRGLALPTRSAAIAAAAAAEILFLFAVPLASYPHSGRAQLAGVDFLRRNLGLQRFVTLGPIQPNYGSFFGLAQVNHNDLPVPQSWVDYTRRHLDPKADPIVFMPSSPEQLLASLPAYAAIGARYAVTAPNRTLPGLAMVHADSVMRIWEIPRPRAYFTADGCALTVRSRTAVDARCRQASQLTRLELYLPGWQATVNGRLQTPVRQNGVFQVIPLPAGPAEIRFAFEPPWIRVGYALAMAGLLLLGLILFRHRRTTDPQPMEATI